MGELERPTVVGLGEVLWDLLEGRGPQQICERANRLASYVCSQDGAMPPVPAQLAGGDG